MFSISVLPANAPHESAPIFVLLQHGLHSEVSYVILRYEDVHDGVEWVSHYGFHTSQTDDFLPIYFYL